jgi:HD-GYP domain-containing protein (c-di-GMP phosphodiesterase class II)
VGKQRVPRAILEKPGRPTSEEFAEIRRHPEYGQEILAACPGLPESVPLVALQHHERTDGSGYPQGLTTPQIHPHSLITAVADSFDAMTTNRPYHKGCAPRQAVLELYGLADRRLDGRAVQALIRLVGVYPVGTRIVLNTGERGVVLAANPHDATRPVVLIDEDSGGRRVPCPYVVDLQTAPCRIVAAGS